MITGGRILQITADRNKDKENSALENMNVNVNIDGLRFEKDKVIATYTHTTQYTPDIANIKLVGEVHFEENEKTRKEIEDKWKKDKQLSSSFAEEVLTSISFTASAVGTLIAFGLGVTAPINVPRARVGPSPSLPGMPAKPAAQAA